MKEILILKLKRLNISSNFLSKFYKFEKNKIVKKIKSLLLLGIFVFTFSSCKKCKECSHEGYSYSYEYEYDQFGNFIQTVDSVKSPNMEICRDDFDSKDEYEDYIEFVEDEYEFDCKSDFWN